MKRIVVIHVGGIGDLIQSAPALDAIRAKWPDARITLIGRPDRAVLAQMSGLVDERADFDSATKHTAWSGADLVIDFVSKSKGQIPISGARRTMVVQPLPPATWTHPASDWVYHELAAALGLPPSAQPPELSVPWPLIEAVGNFMAKKGIAGPFAAIHPGSGSPKKNWPTDRFLELATTIRTELRLPIVWLLGPAEVERHALTAPSPGDMVITSFALDRLAAVLALARVYAGNDSGITHLAAAVRSQNGRATPTVALFGPSDPRVWGPRGDKVRLLHSRDSTMGGISVESAWAEIEAALH
jgi:ADP-heptose:LPS heptosyltransferase